MIPAVLLAKDLGVGDLAEMNLMTGEHLTPEMLKINPWHQMPNMSDGDVHIAESGAIIRYIANKYAPDKYGGTDWGTKATIDWAIDWANTNFSKNYGTIWYPTTGFGAPPEDQDEANKKALENLETFAAKFLCGPGKFIGGFSTPTIADYVCATRFHMCSHKAVNKVTGFEMPAKIKIYILDFMTTVKSKDFLKAHDGFMDSKLA